ncbi:hypothetical protein B0T25DRAFT_52632 [Lasiosphaeria hispida]|uniref:Uncharacterized protein n=1 Tax=Lasiosphaeria hispida TaxID=260671 RepID=A0AAJ0MKL0_9PEZI|nr:hypothetical protein B0T25DRAFT_52632 [Lasiosphaeria hispida]
MSTETDEGERAQQWVASGEDEVASGSPHLQITRTNDLSIPMRYCKAVVAGVLQPHRRCAVQVRPRSLKLYALLGSVKLLTIAARWSLIVRYRVARIISYNGNPRENHGRAAGGVSYTTQESPRSLADKFAVLHGLGRRVDHGAVSEQDTQEPKCPPMRCTWRYIWQQGSLHFRGRDALAAQQTQQDSGYRAKTRHSQTTGGQGGPEGWMLDGMRLETE